MGHMDFNIPVQTIAHFNTPELLNGFVKEQLMPEVIQQTIKSFINSLPMENREEGAARIGKCTVRLEFGEAPLEYHWVPEPGSIKVSNPDE